MDKLTFPFFPKQDIFVALKKHFFQYMLTKKNVFFRETL